MLIFIMEVIRVLIPFQLSTLKVNLNSVKTLKYLQRAWFYRQGVYCSRH